MTEARSKAVGRLRVVFMGTPSFAESSLRALAERHDVGLVLTAPDAVRGRGKRLEPSPVKSCAGELGIPVVETRKITDDVLRRIEEARPDVIAVAAFGCFLPSSVLDLPPLGCLNVHASLLPRWRGAAPIQRAILAGDERVGVSIMRLVLKMDAGPYCRQASVEAGGKGCDDLTKALAKLGASELVAAIDDIVCDEVTWHEQDEGDVTLAPKVTKAEMRLDPTDTAATNALKVRASSDAAPARCVVGSRGMRVLEACPREKDGVAMGEMLVSGGKALLGCADGCLELVRVRPDGRAAMSAADWARGVRSERLAWGVV